MRGACARGGTAPGSGDRGGESAGGRATGVPYLGVPGRGAPDVPVAAEPIPPGSGDGALHGRCNRLPAARQPKSARPAERATRPVTMAAETRRGETGAMGAPGSHRVPGATGPACSRARCRARSPAEALEVRPLAGPVGHSAGAAIKGGSPPDAPTCSIPRTSTSARATPTSATPRPPSASASSPRSRRPWTSRSRRRSTSFLVAGDLFDSNVQPRRSVERVAAELARLVAGADPHRPRPGHPRRLRPRLGLPRLRPRGDGRRAPRATTSSRSSRRTSPWVHLPALDAVVHGPVFADEARAVQPAARPRAALEAPRATWQIGVLHARARDPGPDGPATRSSSPTRRSRRAGSTTSRSATGTAPRSAKAGASRTPTPARRSPSPSTRTAPARCSS